MNSIALEHVPVAELPAEWRSMLAQTPGATVTVRIESEEQDGAEPHGGDDPLFGMWNDREDRPMPQAMCAPSAPVGLIDTLALSHGMRLAGALIARH